MRLNFKKPSLNFKKSQTDIDPEGINFLDLGQGRTIYQEEMGEDPPEGMVFVDIDEDTGPDVLWDLNERIPLPDSSIGGTINLGQVIVYLQNPALTAQEMLRIAKPGTFITISTNISTKDVIADAETWGLNPAEIEVEDEASLKMDSEWAEKSNIFLNILNSGAQLVDRELSGIYEEDAHVFYTFQKVNRGKNI